MKTTKRLWTRWAALLALTAVMAACGAAVTPAPEPAANPEPPARQASCDNVAISVLERGAGVHGAIVSDTLHMGGATAPATCMDPANQSLLAGLSMPDDRTAQAQQSQYYLIVIRYPGGNRLYVLSRRADGTSCVVDTNDECIARVTDLPDDFNLETLPDDVAPTIPAGRPAPPTVGPSPGDDETPPAPGDDTPPAPGPAPGDDTAAPAYARINFRFTGGAVTGWNRDSSKDIDKAQLRKIKPGALAVIDNGVVLVGTTRAGQVFAFKNGRRFPGADITGIGIDPVNGLSYNRTTNKLAIIAGGYREPVKVFKLSRPGTADQRHDEVAGDEIEVSKLAVGRLGSVWCMAWRGDELWVIDGFGLARVFKSGTVTKHVKLPGTEGVGAATFVGDVLIYGGGGDAVYAYNVATDERVPGLELTGSQVTAGLSGSLALAGAAYDSDAEILYLGGIGFYVAAFRASKAVTAYPEASLYGYRTMSKARLQAEAREQHVKSLDETAGTLSWVKVAADGTETPATWTPNHVGALIATLSPAAGLYSESTLPPVNWVIEGTAPAGFDLVSPARDVSEMNVPRRLPSSWLGLVFRVKIGAAVVSEVVLPWTGFAASVSWNQRVTGLGSNVYLVSATNDATVRRVKIVLQREWTVTTENADKDIVYLVGNGETLLANTVFELLAWV